MDNTIIKREEVGDYRITIRNDYYANCPIKDWDMLECFLYEYDNSHRLSDYCNWEEVWGKHSDSNHSMEASLRVLIEENCDFDLLVKYIKQGKKDGVRLRYEPSEHMWKLEVYEYWYNSKNWDLVEDIEPAELCNKHWNVFYNLLEYYGQRSLLEILRECGKNIYVTTWGTTGYSQGDYVSGIAFVTKERYDKFCGRKDIPWTEAAQACIDEEVKCIGMWMWGDVIGYELEKKVRFKKIYEDPEREDEDDYEWENVDSCWGYYMTSDELIEEVISEHGLKDPDAA